MVELISPSPVPREREGPSAKQWEGEGGYAASWKMIPRVKRLPKRTRLTPCRIVTR